MIRRLPCLSLSQPKMRQVSQMKARVFGAFASEVSTEGVGG